MARLLYRSHMNLVELFKGLSDPVRFRIAHLLCQKDEICVCHLTEALGLPQSTISRHLNTLKHAGLVHAERRGKWVYYQLVQGNPAVSSIAELIQKQTSHTTLLQQDLAKINHTNC